MLLFTATCSPSQGEGSQKDRTLRQITLHPQSGSRDRLLVFISVSAFHSSLKHTQRSKLIFLLNQPNLESSSNIGPDSPDTLQLTTIINQHNEREIESEKREKHRETESKYATLFIIAE